MAKMEETTEELNRLEDGELILKTLKGNPKSFEVLVRRYQNLVYNIIYKMTSNRELSADCTQETFLKVYRALDKFDRGKSFRPWLLKIARNTTLSHLRQKNMETSLDEMSSQEEPVSNKDPLQELEQKQSQATFMTAVDHLATSQKEVFLLKYQHDLPYNEISEITGLSISSIKSLLFRARENLRKKLTLTDSGVEVKE